MDSLLYINYNSLVYEKGNGVFRNTNYNRSVAYDATCVGGKGMIFEPQEPIVADQFNHQPTYELMEVVYNYAKESKYKRALDIGASLGLTSLSILMAGTGKLDMLSPKADPSLLNKYGLGKRIKIYKGLSQDIMPTLKERYQFIVVDGDHNKEVVASDLIMAWELLDDGGIMVCDDYGHPKFATTVKEAVDEFGKISEVVNGKAIIRK